MRAPRALAELGVCDTSVADAEQISIVHEIADVDIGSQLAVLGLADRGTGDNRDGVEAAVRRVSSSAT